MRNDEEDRTEPEKGCAADFGLCRSAPLQRWTQRGIDASKLEASDRDPQRRNLREVCEAGKKNPYYNLAANGRTVLTLDTQDIRAYNTRMYPLMMKEKAKECGTG